MFRRAVISVALGCAWPACACGPDFPNTLLDQGDAAVLAAPVGSFRLEIERIKPSVAPCFRVRSPKEQSTPWQQTVDADLADLRVALLELKMSPKQSDALLAACGAFREQLRKKESE